MPVNGSPLVLPANVADLLPREPMLKAHEWKLVWRNADPRRVQVVARWRPRPDWATHEYEPVYDSLNEDTACRAILRTFVSEGWEVEAIDDAMGEAIATWAANPQRTMSRPLGDKNDLVRCYNAVRSHLVDGGRLRDVPVNVAEVVGQNFGFHIWRHWLQAELEQFGPFPEPYRSLVEDLWGEGDDVNKRTDGDETLQRREEGS